MANSRVDLPQPDSPTMPTNSPRPTLKLTSWTARTAPRQPAYSTDRPDTSRIGSGLATPDPLPLDAPDRPQGRVADLVERVVEQCERRAEGDDAEAGNDDPQRLAGLEGLLVLGPVEHRAPAGDVGVAEADELEAGGEQHCVQRVGGGGGGQQRGVSGE